MTTGGEMYNRKKLLTMMKREHPDIDKKVLDEAIDNFLEDEDKRIPCMDDLVTDIFRKRLRDD